MSNLTLLIVSVLQLNFWPSSAFVITNHDAATPLQSEKPRLKPEIRKQYAPEVVFQCGYRNRFLDQNTGDWVSDRDIHATCLRGKLDILKYCRKVYPTLKVNNIVEGEHLVTINDWCKADGGQPCKWSFLSKPFRCLVGEYESEALLVPKGCHFGHVENRTLCEAFTFWNRSAQIECSKRLGDLHVQSFAMLEPCGLDMFSGVEFVCCPDKPADQEPELRVKVHLEPETGSVGKPFAKPLKNKKLLDGDFDDDSDDDGEDEDDEDDEDDVIDGKGESKTIKSTMTSSTGVTSRDVKTSSRKTSTATSVRKNVDDDDEDDDEADDSEESKDFDKKPEDLLDVYFKVADPEYEHERYHQALDRLEKKHKDKISGVMKEWSELETRYQTMLQQDPKHAQVFRHEMISRFQKTVAALEEERKEQKHQIEEVHEQRIEATLNERKRDSIRRYRQALAKENPSKDKILLSLKAYVRIEEKERFHSLNRYKHLLRSDSKQAEDIKSSLLRKLSDVDVRINGIVALLSELKPEMAAVIKSDISHFWRAYRAQNTPDIQDKSLLRTEHTDNGRLLETYKKQYQAEHSARKAQEEANRIAVDALALSTALPNTKSTQKIFDKNDVLPVKLNAAEKAVKKIEKLTDLDLTVSQFKLESTKAPEIIVFDPVVEIAGGGDDNNLKEEKILDEYRPFGAYAKQNVLQHQSTIMEQNLYEEQRMGGSTILVLGLAGAALMACLAVGIVVVRRRSFNHRQGFVEVDACTPEERHVSLMQGNGYENPTYKYFDDKI